jgi:hypothetical protein
VPQPCRAGQSAYCTVGVVSVVVLVIGSCVDGLVGPQPNGSVIARSAAPMCSRSRVKSRMRRSY